MGDGSPSITSLLFDRYLTTLTCTSTGGPPTTVSWRKDGQPINETVYEQSQRLVDAETSTYENVLFNDEVTNFVSSFTCEVSNARGTFRETTQLNGVSIVRDQLNVGASATASCLSDTPAIRMEWLQDGAVLASDTSTQQLDLVFSPVSDSIHNQVYVCRVTREWGAQAEQNFTAAVDVPPTALTATVSSSGIARAGMVYNLNCTVFKTVGGLINSPTATWTDVSTGMAVTNGNGITVSTTTDDMSVTSTLTFDPLRTTHEGSFVCGGTLTSPALNAPLIPSFTEELEILISTPDVRVTAPLDGLFAGRTDPLTLTCAISINSATDTDIALSDMDVTWLRGSTRLSNGDARVTISSASGSRPSFTSTLTLDPLSIADNTTFTCRARARPPPNVPSFVIASEMREGMMSVVVNLPSPPNVSIDPFNHLEMAGQPLILNCSASIQEGIRGTPELTWTREDASLSSDVTPSPPLLSFPSLRTSHAGRYTCSARLTIPEAGVDLFGDSTTNVSIRFMPPPPIISGSPRNTSFFQGLNLTFTCSITLGNVVDTPVIVRGIWTRNGAERMDGDDNGRITINSPPMSSPPYEVTLRFNPLDTTDNGIYKCEVTVTPQDTTFISTATTSNSRTIDVAVSVGPGDRITTATSAVPVGPGDRISTATSPPQTAAGPATSDSDNTVAIVGGVVAVVIALIIAATTVIIVALVSRRRRAEFSPNQKALPYEAPASVMLSDLSPTNKEREVYETIEADHEYEMLDTYNLQPQYDDVTIPPPKSKAEAETMQPKLASTGDYEFTQCPAYVSVATTSIHGKPVETPSTQPTTVHDDQNIAN